ncbi:MAG: aldo/keto reductase [Treponema sp.]|nr:aldo/keto reductase [Treponema sp.]
MIYRPIGATGMSAGIIGLGAEHLDNKPCTTVEEVIHTALDHGVNIIDVFMPGQEVRQNIGRALAGRRDKVLIQGHICSTDINQQYDISRDLPTIKKYFENLLRDLKTDYIDFGMLFFIDTEKHFAEVFEGDALPYALELKQKGHVRAFGASSHNPVIARKIVETGLVDLLMFSLNPAFDMASADTYVLDYLAKEKAMDYEKKRDPDRAVLYRICEQRGVAITVMKALGAGKLISPQHTPFTRPLTVTQCIHYALTRPAVVSVLPGCCTREQMLNVLYYLEAGEDEKDYSAVLRDYQGSMKGSCVYCNHCQPCPVAINIADVIKYLDIASLDKNNIPPSVLSHYRTLEYSADTCTACGSCEERCPFSVPVIAKMQEAASLFGKSSQC